MDTFLWNILLVDDDEDDYTLARHMLSETRGSKVTLHWAQTYADGWHALQTGSYDAALVDYDLGAQNGIDLIRKATGAGLRTPIILFTGRGSYDVDMEAMQAGATLYLTKGETNALMLERGIRYAIERKQSEEAIAEAHEMLIQQKQELELANHQLREILAAQQQSEERFRSLFEGMTEGYALHEIVTDEDGTPCDYLFIEINPSFERLTGLSRDAVVGRLKSQVLHGEDHWVSIYGEVALTGKPVHFEEYSPTLQKHYEIYAFCPAARQFAVMFMDITERKKAEVALQQYNQELKAANAKADNERRLLAAVMESLPVGVAITNEAGGTILTNQAYESLWAGPTPIPENFKDYTAFRASWADTGEPLAPEDWASAQAILKGETVSGQILEIQRFDGSRAIVHNSASPVRDSSGAIIGSAVAIQDLSGLRTAQKALTERENELQIIMDAEPALISYIDADFYYRRVNQSYERWFGRSAAETQNRHVRDVLGEVAWQAVKPYMEQALAGEQVVYEQELPYQGGGPRWVHVTYTPHKNNAGTVLGFVVHVMDIGERIQAERELQRYAEQLRRSNQELENFALVISHDLQEPLRKIEMFSSKLQKTAVPKLNANEQEYLERMQNAARRMRKMIEDLLLLSRVTLKGQPFAPVDLNHVAQAVVDDLEARIHQTKGNVELHDLPTLQADSTQMHLLLLNLIGNGLKFHLPDTPPLVKVTGRQNGDNQVEIQVADNGIGFEMEYAERIFQPFQRLHGRTEFEGNGVGLAISRKIVERHGGTISARSEPGSGSTFIITLPIHHRGQV